MTVGSQELKFRTSHEGEILDITDQIQRIVKSSELKDGVATLFVPGSTEALTTIEYEPGLLTDFPLALERLAPKEAAYEHDNRWHDGNGHSSHSRPIPLSFLWRSVRLTLKFFNALFHINLGTN